MKKAYSYIRFSTPDQIKGDSLRRQTEATERYCADNGLTLDTSLTLRDLGLSAYHGKHKTKGALGQFLKLVEAGEIEPGSVLIVENLDRLSREQVLDALNQFTGIIQAGIRLVTLQDGMAYDKQSIKDNWTQLIISITYMARAHEESETKSKRMKAAWAQKRKNVVAGDHIMTRKVPQWIKVKPDGRGFELIPEVVEVLELVYQMKLSGMGADKITRTLNQRKDIYRPPASKRNKYGAWSKGSIVRWLWYDKTPIGEYQPHHSVKDEQTGKITIEPAGEPIKNYYPAAISEDLYYAVQKQMEENSKKDGRGGGRKAGFQMFSPTWPFAGYAARPCIT